MTHAFKRHGIAAAIALVTCISTPALAGNGLDVNGPHYNLNILGKTNCGIASTGSSGHVIQVLLNSTMAARTAQLASTLDKRNKIFLSPGPFGVTRPERLRSDGAAFSLPAGGYSVWARSLAKPGGKATLSLCAVDTMGTTDTTDDMLACNTGENVVVDDAQERPAGVHERHQGADHPHLRRH